MKSSKIKSNIKVYMLSFKNGSHAIARIDGGANHNKTLRINFEGNINDRIPVSDPFQYLNKKWFSENNIKLNNVQKKRLEKCILTNKAPDDDKLEDIYDECMAYLQSISVSEIILDDGKFTPLVEKDKDKGCRMYISGATGSGKSTYASKLVKEYKKIYPNRPFYIFSQVKTDKVLDKLKPIRIELDEDLYEEPIDIEKELGKAIILFDDVETIPNSKVKSAVKNLRDQLLSEGRHYESYCICTNHLMCDNKNTKQMLNESGYVTFFNNSGGMVGIDRFLKTYCGLDNKMINKIKTLPSRWVTIFQQYPAYCLYETGCFLLGGPIKMQEKPKKRKLEVESDNSETESDYSD